MEKPHETAFVSSEPTAAQLRRRAAELRAQKAALTAEINQELQQINAELKAMKPAPEPGPIEYKSLPPEVKIVAAVPEEEAVEIAAPKEKAPRAKKEKPPKIKKIRIKNTKQELYRTLHLEEYGNAFPEMLEGRKQCSKCRRYFSLVKHIEEKPYEDQSEQERAESAARAAI